MAMTRPPQWWPEEGDEPDPRWSLANERTLLAYSRTGLAFLVAGLAVVGSRSAAGTSIAFAALGIPMIAIAAATAWSSRRRFLVAQRAMRTTQPIPGPRWAALLPMILGVIAVVSAVIGALEVGYG